MADLVITLSIGQNGELTQVPHPARVNAGDSVVWISDADDVSISFTVGNNPFVGSGAFTARKGKQTPPGRVRSDVPVPKKFACTVMIGNKEFRDVSGVDTPGSGPN